MAPAPAPTLPKAKSLAEHPVEWPHAFEAGTPNTLALFGLAAALRHRAAQPARGDEALARLRRFEAAANGLPGVRFLPAPARRRLAVASFTHARYDAAELGAIFAGAGFHVRTGHLCAPWLLQRFGADAGVVRVSLGHAEHDDALPALLELLAELSSG